MVRGIAVGVASALMCGTAIAQCGSWSNAGVCNSEVWTISHWDPDGPGAASPLLIVAGTMTQIAGVGVPLIASLDGTTWRGLGAGVDALVFITAPYTGPAGTQNLLAVGGQFTHAGGAPAARVAVWNGAAWAALGSGISGGSLPFVQSLVQWNNLLVAGGSFSNAGGSPASNIAAWNGTSWSQVGEGLVGEVRILAVYQGELIAGGTFAQAGDGRTVRYVARWTGTRWEELGGGTNAGINALFAEGNDLYVGGYFNRVGAVPSNCIARWDGSAWHNLDVGITGGNLPHTHSIARYAGDLYASGQYQLAGGINVNHIARFDGSSWTGLGGGVTNGTTNGHVMTIHAFAGALYAGGMFTGAGGVSGLGNFAAWRVCVADVDDGSGSGACDGGVTIDDLLYYLFVFDQGLPRADVDDGTGTGTPDGGVTIDDLLYYLFRFDVGC